ncbi:DUF724 domain-containing protein 7-like [Silene latifolia]|uniref:DUF724 domain-containing protein 7-like n=1 Tax=Silene latifolia TaxID=37657 RepID=UPI003D774F8C
MHFGGKTKRIFILLVVGGFIYSSLVQEIPKMVKTTMPDEGKQLVASANYKSTVSESRKEGEVTSLKRKRGRPPKVLFQLGSPNTNEAGQLVETGVMQDAIATQSCYQSKEVQQEKDETSAGNSNHDNDATGRPDETLIQSTVTVPRENQELPFAKNSLIWGVIESMEVLKRFPQKPHFLPLCDSKEEYREGLAIGSMVTFTSLAERVSQARFDDPKSLLDGYLEALVDLEELGFNVGPVRELLHKLISIKTRDEQTENTCKEMESQMKEQAQEKSKMEDEMKELEKKIKELKDKHALVMSKTERKDTELTMLQLSMDSVKGSREDARQEFGKVTASLRNQIKSNA